MTFLKSRIILLYFGGLGIFRAEVVFDDVFHLAGMYSGINPFQYWTKGALVAATLVSVRSCRVMSSGMYSGVFCSLSLNVPFCVCDVSNVGGAGMIGKKFVSRILIAAIEYYGP